MIGFAAARFRANKFSGLIAQGLGTSMLQIKNLKNPQILLPQIISSGISGALAATLFKLECNPAGSGMGTSGLVGVLQTISESSGKIPAERLTAGIALCFFLLPALLGFIVSEFMRKKGYIKFGDQSIDN
jgi:uncharacterized membrane protein